MNRSPGDTGGTPRWWRDLPVLLLVSATTVVPALVLGSKVLSADDLTRVWRRPGVLDAVWFSVWQGALSTLLVLAVALPLTWCVSRLEFPGRRLATAVITVPFVLPTVVVAAAFIALFPTGLERSITAVLCANVFFNIAVVVRLVGPALSAVDEGLLDGARVLGAGPWRRCTTVVWPLTARPLRASAALVFLMCSTSYGVVRLLAPTGTQTVETEIYRRAIRLGDIGGATALAATQTAVLLIALGLGARRRTTERVLTIGLHRRRAGLGATIVAWAGSLLITIPMIVLVASSLRSDGRWTTAGWRAVFSPTIRSIDVDITGSITTSLLYATIASVVVTCSVVVARNGRFVTVWGATPVAVSAVVVGLGILVTYDHEPIDFRGSWALIPVVHASIALPFAQRAVSARRAAIPRGCLEAASTLGASPWRRFVHIELPLLRPALATSFGVSAAVSLGEFGASSFLSRSDRPTLPVAVSQLLSKVGAVPHTAAMSTAVVLLLLVVLVVVALDRSLAS